jgi:hypothetical protein
MRGRFGKRHFHHGIDSNHRRAVAALNAIPQTSAVSIAGVGRKCLDILVGHRGATFLLEMKDGTKRPSARRLTEGEQEFRREWQGGPAHVVGSVDAAIREVTGAGLEDHPPEVRNAVLAALAKVGAKERT